jgi:hypothetical protein
MPDMQGIFGDSKARVIRLERSQKKLQAATVERSIEVFEIKAMNNFGIAKKPYPGGHLNIVKQKFRQNTIT